MDCEVSVADVDAQAIACLRERVGIGEVPARFRPTEVLDRLAD